ncbi:MAG: GAF domain-containing protein, partial [Sphaerochaetaceae bacterium]
MHEYSSNVLIDQISALTDGWDGSIERRYCHLSNVSALLAQYFENINWVGFYLMKEDRTGLVLGPFQGKVACTDISLEHGVCGAAARTKESLRVEDVHAFPGHIACDSASNSELVVPLLAGDKAVVG